MQKSTHLADGIPMPITVLSSNNPSLQKQGIRTGLAIFFSLLFSISFAQDSRPQTKLDPVFRHLIDKKKGRLITSAALPSPQRVISSTGLAARSQVTEELYSCIVYTTNGRALRDSGLVVNSILPTFATVWASIDQLEQLALMPQVNYVEAPLEDQLHNDVGVGASGASLLHAGRLNNTVYKGKGVIVAVYDSGIDWDHPDFRNPTDPTKSRILRLWDQTITAGTGEAPPAGFSYGVEYSQAQINDELDGTPTNFVRERDINGHGTHVAGTAAGNGAAIPSGKYAGMAPEADLIIIKGGNGSFPTTNTIDAITYLKGLANTLGRPIVLNMSIGGQSGPHDGTLAHELAVDDFTASGPGRVVVISAGNDNGTNLHTRTVLAAGASTTLSFTVPSGTTGTDVFQFSTYAFTNGTVTATATTPTGQVSPVATPGTVTQVDAAGNAFRVYVTNDLYATNGKRYINYYLTRNGSNTSNPQGTWTLTLTNTSGSTMTFDGWLNYKNTAFAGTALVGGDNSNLVGSPGNATSAITAASYVGKLKWFSSAVNGTYTYNFPEQQDNISTFSAMGPRRDGVQKPEIAAHGQAVISVLSSNATSSDAAVPGLYQRMQGTSMSSPGVAGAAALVLQASPSFTAAQVKSSLTNAATSDALTEAVPNARWGYGRLDVFKAIATVTNCSSTDRRTYQYDNSMTGSTDGAGVTQGTGRVAVKFTPDITGKVGGIFYHASATIADIVVEMRADNNGVPGALLATQNIAVNQLAIGAFNYLDLSSMNVSVSNGTNYFVVLYRNPSSSANWSIRYDNATAGNRSFTSLDGVSWNAQTYNWRIRTVVYNDGLSSGELVTNSSTDTKTVSSTIQFSTNCRVIAQLAPNGAAPVNGTVTGKVWIETSVPKHFAKAFVARHYEMTPAANASTATGRVTLYFTQAEFTAFNADPSTTLDLPSGPNDASGKANLLISKYAGTSNDGSGLPGTYSGEASYIDPADEDIIWNAGANRWEVSFDVTGFGGFFAQTASFITVYYPRTTATDLSLVSNWTDAQTGIGGTSPLNFTSAGQTFNVTNNVAKPNVAGAWTISGGSNLVLNNTDSLLFRPGSSLTIGAGSTADFNGKSVTLKSTAVGTAHIGELTGSITNASAVTVERYIPARRAWRVLAAPVAGSQNINAAWQEGAKNTSSNPTPGFGTHITGGATYGSSSNGFDQSTGAATSIKTYSSTANNWVEQQNTNVAAVGANAYMVFVRGDRGIALSTNNVPATTTTLRATGTLKTGNQTFGVNPSGFTAIPNPYASPINFATITRSGVQNNFYLWDPKLGGANGTGAYVLLSDNGSGGYSMVPTPVSAESQYIQSGQGFLVRPSVSGTAGSITIKESDKSATAATDVFRSTTGRPASSTSEPVILSPESEQGLRIALTTASGNSLVTLDEAFASYKSSYANNLDDLDAVKMDNVNENLAMVSDNQTLMLERRQLPQVGDAIELKVWNTQPQTYTFQFNAVQMASAGLQALVEDRYLKTVTPVNLDGKSQLTFTVTGDAASSGNRFRVVFAKKVADAFTSLPKGITVYPNPFDGSMLNIGFADKAKGSYQLALTNSAGQVVFRKTIQHAGGTATQPVVLGQKLPKGIYQLQVSGSGETTTIAVTCH